MKKVFVVAILAMGVASFAQKNLTLRSNLNYSKDLSNIWGYTDSLGNEYALIGVTDGFAIVDITIPDNINQLFYYKGPDCIWREIKTWKSYAYIVSECFPGILIYDLSNLPNSVDTIHALPGFNSSHTIFIDEKGFAYVFGSDIGNGGAQIYNLANPENPVYAGEYDLTYIHDGFARGDTLWAAELSLGQFSVVDVSDKNNPVLLGIHETPHRFTHNLWPSNDNKYVFTTDEKSNAYVAAYDVSDLSNIKEVDKYRSNPGSGVVPHNTYYHNGFLVTSYYKDGVIIIDGNKPDNLIEVANYDTYPISGGDGMDGCWGVYPYFSSGNIVASDMDKGLYVLTPTYTRACYFEGTVTDSICGSGLPNVTIEILGTGISETSDASGNFKFGTADSGTYNIAFSLSGYQADTLKNISLTNGVITTKNINLFSKTAFNFTGKVIDIITRNVVSNVQINIESFENFFSFTSDNIGLFNSCNFLPGTYQVIAGKWGYKTTCLTGELIDSTKTNFEIEMVEGYYDDFAFDYGWHVSGATSAGVWETANPTGTYGDTSLSNPEDDVSIDCNDKCFVTGNGGGAPGNDDVDKALTRLTSPIMDLSNYVDPFVRYYRWFYNGYLGSTPDDTLTVRITDGTTDTSLVEKVHLKNTANSAWTRKGFWVKSHFTNLSSIQVIFETADLGEGNWLEAGVDVFEIRDSLGSGVNTKPITQNVNYQVYPNPFHDKTTLSISFPEKYSYSNAQFTVYDVLGKQTHSFKIPSSLTEYKLNFSIADKGIYCYRLVIDEKDIGVGKLVVY